MSNNKVLIFASADKNHDGFYPEEIIENLNKFYDGLEYGDVAEGEYQIWEYPSGKIFDIKSDREVSKDEYYTTPYTTKGTMWLPKLVEVEEDKEKVREVYDRLNQSSQDNESGLLRRLFRKK